MEIAQAAEPHGGAVRARVHVDDVGSDRDVHRGRHSHPGRGGEDAGATEAQPLAQHRSTDRLTEAEALADTVADRLVQEGAGLVRHPERAAVEPRADVLGGAAAPG